MSKLVVCTNLTLDGVMQAPTRPDEDTRDGFTHGGWATPYAAMTQAGDVFVNAGGLLLGRRTYEDFSNVWPKRVDSPFTPWLNDIRKYVASSTLKEPLPWVNSMLLKGDVGKAVAALKRELEKDVLILGSGELVRSLMRDNVVDEWVLLIHPLVLGSGRRLFASDSPYTALSLVNSTVTPNGVLVATYHPAATR
jgi:dihydrofolate reductase